MSTSPFCNPSDLDDTASACPVPAAPASAPATDPSTLNPNLPATAVIDPKYAASLASTKAALAQAISDLNGVLGANSTSGDPHTQVGKAAVTTAGAISAATKLGIDQANTLLTLYAKVGAWVKEGSATATDSYQYIIQPGNDLINQLSAQQATVASLAGALGAAGSMAEGIATTYNMVTPEQLKAMNDLGTKINTVMDNLGVFSSWASGGVDPYNGAQQLANFFKTSFPNSTGLVSTINSIQSGAAAITNGLNEVTELSGMVDDFLAGLQVSLMAGCQLIQCVSQYTYNIQYAIANIPYILGSTLASLIPTTPQWIKMPQPIGLILSNTEGMISRLTGFSAVGKCFNLLSDSQVATLKKLTPEALGGAITGLLAQMAATLAASQAGGFIASLLKRAEDINIPNPLDPIRTLFGAAPGLNPMKPPRPVVLPEEGALLGFLSGAGAAIGWATSVFTNSFPIGSTGINPTDLFQQGTNPDGSPGATSVTPHPAATLGSMATATKEAMANVKTCQENAAVAQVAFDAATLLIQQTNEAAERQAVALAADVAAKSTMGTNLACDDDLNNPSATAQDWAACQPPKPLPDSTGISNQVSGIPGATPGSPNSPIDNYTFLHPPALGSPATDSTTVLAGLPLLAVPDNFYEAQVLATLEALTDEAEELALLLLLKSESERRTYAYLKSLWSLLDAIRLDTVRGAAHASLLAKAISQGYAANSPYVWIAEGELTYPVGIDFPTFISNFLRHDRSTDIRPFAQWLAAAGSLTESTPFPVDLTTDENAAAQESLSAWRLLAPLEATLSGLLLTMRLRSDSIGRALGFEHFVATAILMLLRQASALATEGSSAATVATVFQSANSLADQLTQKAMIQPMLKGLATGSIA